MNQLAVKPKPSKQSLKEAIDETPLPVRNFIVIEGNKETEKHSTLFSFPTQSVLMIAILLTFFQILDGILTYIGVSRFGNEAEYNLLIRKLLLIFNPISVLIFIKFIAIGIIAFLTSLSSYYKWIKVAMISIGVFYLIAAILPWTFILVR